MNLIEAVVKVLCCIKHELKKIFADGGGEVSFVLGYFIVVIGEF